MHPRAAASAWMVGLLAGGLIASGATPAWARPLPAGRVAGSGADHASDQSSVLARVSSDRPLPAPHRRSAKPRTTLLVRAAPPVVTVGEPSALVATLTTGRGTSPRRTFTAQQLVDGTWTTLGSVAGNAGGRAILPLDTGLAGPQQLRVVVEPTSSQPRKVRTVSVQVYPESDCTPRVALVDPAATTSARCLAARLDRWQSAGLMGVGQQLNVSNIGYLAPLTSLGSRRVSVVGFDLAELAAGDTYQFPNPPVETLAGLAHDGAVLSASWHPDNPHTGGANHDRSWHDLGALLDPTTPEHARFWADFDAMMALLHRLQEAGAAVVFRPFHEANGGWFWWGHPHPATYKRLWSEMQRRAAADGVHNIVWGYSFAARVGSWVQDPARLLPAQVDLAGIDAYDPERGRQNAADRVPLGGYAAVARRVKRMALTEVGPQGSRGGAWNPAVITRATKRLRPAPLWAMLWFDDRDGVKQIGSLRGGRSWLDSCPNGFCALR